MKTEWPMTTQQVSALLNLRENRISDQIRYGKVIPEMILGRRAWSKETVLAAAKNLGKDSPTIYALCKVGL